MRVGEHVTKARKRRQAFPCRPVACRPLARPLMSWLALHFDQACAQQLYGSGAEEAEVGA